MSESCGFSRGVCPAGHPPWTLIFEWRNRAGWYIAAVKPIRRLAFNLLAGVSALLCLATGAMWVRSYFAADFWIREKSADVRESIESSEGVIGWWRNGFPPGVFGPANYTTHWSQL